MASQREAWGSRFGLILAMAGNAVGLGNSIAIPAAVAFFGLAQTRLIAQSGSFDLGFQAMPLIFQQMGPLGPLWGCLWFALLFFAGITSSVALAQPAVAFLQDELKLSRGRAVAAAGGLMLAGGLPCVLFLGHGFVDEMDFWAGTFGLVVFGLIEVVLFAWVFGIDRAWAEMTRGADLQLPPAVRFVICWVTLGGWLFLAGAWLAILGLSAGCLVRILATKGDWGGGPSDAPDR